jgi:hypothetical protein
MPWTSIQSRWCENRVAQMVERLGSEIARLESCPASLSRDAVFAQSRTMLLG